MPKCHFIIRTKLVFFAVIFLLQQNLLFSLESSPGDNNTRLLGDEAFNNKLYELATNYYKTYLKNAQNNYPMVRDAYYCLIATYLRSHNLNAAEELFKQVSLEYKDFFKTNLEGQNELNYWQAEIFLSKHEFKKAEEIFAKITKNTKKINNEIYRNSLIGLGVATFKQKNWENSKETFLKLHSYTNNQKIKDITTEYLVLIGLIQNNVTAAETIITQNITNDYSKALKLNLVKIYTLAKQEKFTEAQKIYNDIAKNASKPEALWYLTSMTLAQAYINHNQLLQSIPILEDAFILAPSTYEKEQTALQHLNVLIKLKDFPKTVELTNTFLKYFPDSIYKDDLLYTLVCALANEDKFNEIVTIANEQSLLTTIQRTETNIKTMIEIGKVYIHLKQYNKAEEYFHFVYAHGIDEKQRFKGLYQMAETQLLCEKYRNAINLYAKLQAEFPASEEMAELKIAQTCLKIQNYKMAEDILKNIIKKHPKSQFQPISLILYAETLLKNNKEANAAEAFLSFINKYPNNQYTALAYYNLGNIALNNVKYDDAIKYFTTVTQHYETSSIVPATIYRLLYTNYLTGNNRNAIENAHSLLKQYPQNDYTLQALFWLVDYYIDTTNYNSALNELEYIQKYFPENSSALSKVLYDEEYIYYSTNKTILALQTSIELEKKYPNSELTEKNYYLRGDMYSSENNYQEAISAYTKVIEQNSDHDLTIAATGCVGDCYFAKINYSANKNDTINQAIEYYNKVLNYKTISKLIKIQTLYKLGKCYELLDNKNKAIATLHEAVYGFLMDYQDNKIAEKKWFTKSAISLAQLLQSKKNPTAAKGALKIYELLIQHNIEPTADFQAKIKEIINQYKFNKE